MKQNAKICVIGETDVMKLEVFILGGQTIDQKKKKGWWRGRRERIAGADLGILIGGFFFREFISNNHLISIKLGGPKAVAMLVTLITQTTKWEVVKICASQKRPLFFFFFRVSHLFSHFQSAFPVLTHYHHF